MPLLLHRTPVNIHINCKKVNVPIVSIALSQLCDLRVGAHLRLHGRELAVSCRHSSVMWTVGHTSSTTCRYLPGFLGRYQIILLGDRGTSVWTTCPGSLLGSGTAVGWQKLMPTAVYSNFQILKQQWKKFTATKNVAYQLQVCEHTKHHKMEAPCISLSMVSFYPSHIEKHVLHMQHKA